MEFISKKSKSIRDIDERRQPTVSVCPEFLYFSSKAMSDFKLSIGSKLVFVIDMGRLYFYIAKKKEDEGFNLRVGDANTKPPGGKCCGRKLVNVLKERFPTMRGKQSKKYPIRFSNTQINECLTFEILIDKHP